VIRINKHPEPEWLLEFKKRNKQAKYDDLDADTRAALRTALVAEQFFICGYCCGEISEKKAHNEHIRPQTAYPKETLNYNNIIASCNGYRKEGETCGHKKHGEYNASTFISPLVSPLAPDCEPHFKYYMSGEIIGLDDNAQQTIDLLNLNSFQLRTARRGILAMSGSLGVDVAKLIYLQPQAGKLQPFCNIVRYFINNDRYDEISEMVCQKRY
jgi:uncharacterized protein (TIGR02646 family)